MAVTGTPSLIYAGLSDGRDDVTGLREYTQIWKVETDSPHDGPKTVKAHPAIPQYGQSYVTNNENDPQAFVNDRNAELIDGAENNKLWHVTITFSTATNANSGQPGPGVVVPPIQEIDLAPQIEWDSIEHTVPAYFAYEALLYNSVTGQLEKNIQPRFNNGVVAICNSALDLFDPPIERDEAQLVLRLNRALGSYDGVAYHRYANVLNSDTWYGFPPKSLLMKPIKAVAVFDKGLAYWRVSVEIHVRFDLHFKDVWDSGVREFLTKQDIENNPKDHKGKDPGYNHIKNKDGTFVAENVLLDGKGHALVPPGQALDLREMEPRLWRFRVERMLPFGPLQLI